VHIPLTALVLVVGQAAVLRRRTPPVMVVPVGFNCCYTNSRRLPVVSSGVHRPVRVTQQWRASVAWVLVVALHPSREQLRLALLH
jgi:hypothetical protein